MKKVLFLTVALLVSSHVHAQSSQVWSLTKGVVKSVLGIGLFTTGIRSASSAWTSNLMKNNPDMKEEMIEECVKSISKSNPRANQAQLREAAEKSMDIILTFGVPVGVSVSLFSFLGSGLLFKSAYHDFKNALTD